MFTLPSCICKLRPVGGGELHLHTLLLFSGSSHVMKKGTKRKIIYYPIIEIYNCLFRDGDAEGRGWLPRSPLCVPRANKMKPLCRSYFFNEL